MEIASNILPPLLDTRVHLYIICIIRKTPLITFEIKDKKHFADEANQECKRSIKPHKT